MMDRKLDKLSTVLESFIQRFQGFIASPDMLGGAPDDSRASIEQVNMRREILHENGDRLPEIKLLENVQIFKKNSLSEWFFNRIS